MQELNTCRRQRYAVTTDIREVYEKIKDHYPWFQERLHLYEDIQYPLIKLLSLETQIERLLSPRVWLRTGGSLVIEQTEAFVVIDVNTGRYMGKKTGEESYFKINMEAAKEIPRQLRLRNLSGIILIDFINMKDAKKRRELIDALKEVLAKDRVKDGVCRYDGAEYCRADTQKGTAPPS